VVPPDFGGAGDTVDLGHCGVESLGKTAARPDEEDGFAVGDHGELVGDRRDGRP
jgi:hypothetical protein